MAFQENLKRYREMAGYKSAKDFAKELNIPYATYMGYENKNAEPKYSLLIQIASKLGVTTDELLGVPQKTNYSYFLLMTAQFSIRILSKKVVKEITKNNERNEKEKELDLVHVVAPRAMGGFYVKREDLDYNEDETVAVLVINKYTGKSMLFSVDDFVRFPDYVYEFKKTEKEMILFSSAIEMLLDHFFYSCTEKEDISPHTDK